MNEIKTPRLSIVVTARNDNYGGNLENRIKTFVKIVSYLSDKNQIQTELVFVEYNPPENTPLFSESLGLRTNKYLSIEFIIVPKEFHQKISTHSKIPVLEYVAKNIGIKRSSGIYILATNPDVIISDGIFKFINSTSIDNKHFYRVDRNDISINYFSEQESPESIIDTASRNIYMKWVNDGVRYKSWKIWFRRFIHSRNKKSLMMCPIFNSGFDKKYNPDTIHDKAAGDFLLMHRDLWNKVGGYDETPHNLYLDSYILYVLYCFNIEQKILPFPIYHIEHELGRAGRPGIASEKFESDAKSMLKSKIPYRNINNSWGFPDEKFEEINK